MLVVSPFHPGDADQALTLFRWIRELGGAKGHTLLLIADSRCSQITVGEIERAAGESFDSVKVLPFVDHFRKWPEAPNAAFAFAARHIMAGPREPWLLMEPDCAPLKPGWLDAITAEYKMTGKPFMGARVEVDNVPLHLSGNAIYPGDMLAHAGLALISNDIAWDVSAASQIVPQAHWTKLIEHAWKHPSFESWDQVEREVSKEAVLYHASKDGSLIRLLQERKMNLLPVPKICREIGAKGDGGGQHNLSGGGESRPAESPCKHGDLAKGGLIASAHSLVQPNNTSGSSAPPAQSFFTDILIKSYPPDYEWLRYCLRAIDKFASGFRRIIVVIPDSPEVFGFGLAMSNPNCRTIRVAENGEGYLFQQAVKASAHEYTNADYILHLDSDCILKRPITPETFMRNGKPLWLMSPYSKIDVPWKAITEKFVGEPVEYEYMRRLPILIPRSLHVAAARFCEVKHGMRLTDYILSQPNREFSEFNVLGALAWLRARDEFEWLDTHAEEVAA